MCSMRTGPWPRRLPMWHSTGPCAFDIGACEQPLSLDTMAVQSTSSRPHVIASIMAAMVMVAIEVTIVSTAMPQIVAQLGGLNHYSWVFSSFLLTQTAM